MPTQLGAAANAPQDEDTAPADLNAIRPAMLHEGFEATRMG